MGRNARALGFFVYSSHEALVDVVSLCLSVSLSLCLSVCVSLCLSLSLCLSVSLSLCLSVCLSVCLSACENVQTCVMCMHTNCRYDLKLAGKPEDVGMSTGATIHTKNGLMMHLVPRASASADA